MPAPKSPAAVSRPRLPAPRRVAPPPDFDANDTIVAPPRNIIPFPAPQTVPPPPDPTPTPPPIAAAAPSFTVPTAPVPPLPMPVHVPAPAAASPWAVFDKLGLGPKRKDLPQKTAKLMVSAYRLLGFAVLTIIVVVLVGYLFTSAFYFVSDSWIQPMVVSPTDERVLALQAQATEHENNRDRLAAELRHVDREIEVELAYQAEFARAIRADLSGRTAALDRLRALADDYAGARERIRKSNAAFAAASQRRMSQEYSAGLIDRGDLLSGRFQLAQIQTSTLTLAERQAEYQTRAEELEQEAAALTAILSEQEGEEVPSYDVLRIKQEYDRSRLETAKAIEARDVLKASLERQETVLAGLQRSPYLRALADGADVAFVPYGNLHNLSAGTSLYRCRLGMLICSRAGRVREVLPGEVVHKHPHRDKVLRGQLVEIEIDRAGATEDVLFAGGRPLLF